MAPSAARLHLLLLNSHDLASLCKEVLVIIHEREREQKAWKEEKQDVGGKEQHLYHVASNHCLISKIKL